MRRPTRPRWPASVLLLLAVTATADTFGPPVPDSPTTVPSAKLDALVERLAADSLADRFAAQQAIAAQGSKAIPRLESALSDPRPEVRGRARWALRFIRLNQRAGIDTQTMSLARSYLTDPDPVHRLNLLRSLMDNSPAPHDPVLFRLYTMESDETLRQVLLRSAGATFDAESARLITEGDADAVWTLLEGLITGNTRAAGADYAMFARQTGRLDGCIRRWKARYDNDPTDPEDRQQAAEVLAFLYRAAGRPRDAIGMAREVDNTPLALAILAQQGDWRGFQNEPGLNGICTPVVQAGFKAAAERLGGHPESADGLLLAVNRQMGSDDETRYVPSRVYLLNDDPVRGIDMIASTYPAVAIRMMIHRGDYTRALNAGKAASERRQTAASVAAEVADLRRQLGIDPPLAAPAPAHTGPAPTPPARPAPATSRPMSPLNQAIDCLQNKQFAKAADRFAELAKDAPDEPSNLYLQGYATAAAGDTAAGDALMKTAELIPLGDPKRRWRFATEIGSAGLIRQQNQQLDLAESCGGRFDDIGYSEVFNTRAEDAVKAGRWGDAAAALDRLVLVNQSPDMIWNDPLRFITVPAQAHLMHARDFWSRGMKKESLAEYDRFENYLPIDDAEAIEVVTKLDTAGDHESADKRFARIWDLRTAACTAYPQAPALANDAAWLAACCNRRLDEALAYAETNQKLSPGVGAMDTLAEVHFRRGQRDAAVELSKQILANTPDDPYAKRQAARWATAAVPSTTQPEKEPK